MALTLLSSSWSSSSESILTLDDSSESESSKRLERKLSFVIEVISGHVRLPEKSIMRTFSNPRLSVKEKPFTRSKSSMLLQESPVKSAKHDHGKVGRKISAIARKLTKKKQRDLSIPREEPRQVLKSLEDVKVVERVEMSGDEGRFDPSLTERLNILILVSATQIHHLLKEPWGQFEQALSEAGLSGSQQKLFLHFADERLILDEVMMTSEKLIRAKEQFKETKKMLNEAIKAYKSSIHDQLSKSVRFGEGRSDEFQVKKDQMQLRVLEERSNQLPIVSGDPLLDESRALIDLKRLKIAEDPHLYVDIMDDPQRIHIEYECFLEVSGSISQFEFRKEVWIDKKEGAAHLVEVQYFLNRA